MSIEFPTYSHPDRAKVIMVKGKNGSYAGEAQLDSDIAAFQAQIYADIAAFKTDIEGQLAPIPRFAIDIVEELPTVGISTTTIYLVPGEGRGTANVYAEYIYYNNDWEMLGTVESTVDLDQYYTKSQTYSKTEVDNKFGNLILI
jgi:hypothetical protein